MAIAVLFLPFAVLEARSHLLTNDEIYTVHIAQAPTFRGVLHLSREIDLHPPLHYLTERVALRLPGPRWFSARLPSLMAGLITCLGFFLYTRRRLGNLYGLIAVDVFWFTPGAEFSWSNRPYAQWIAWLTVLLLARDAAVDEERSPWSVPVVLVAACGMVMTHFLGVACLIAFWAAEIVRARSRGRMDWWLMGALLAPAALGGMSYYQLHEVSKNAFPLANLPSWSLVGEIYHTTTGDTVVISTACLLVVSLMFGGRVKSANGERLNAKQEAGLSQQDFILLGCLLMLPIALLVPSYLLKLQFWNRYSAAAVPGWCVIVAWLVAKRFPFRRIVALLLIASSVGYLISRMVTESGAPGNAGQAVGGRAPIPLRNLNPALPIVAASPMTFVEMSDREAPEVSARVYYLTDRQGSMQYAHYTLFENEEKIRGLLGLPSHVEALKAFLAEHPSFYVTGDYKSKDVWLLRKLAADGMTLNYLGEFESTYESSDLYLVSR